MNFEDATKTGHRTDEGCRLGAVGKLFYIMNYKYDMYVSLIFLLFLLQ